MVLVVAKGDQRRPLLRLLVLLPLVATAERDGRRVVVDLREVDLELFHGPHDDRCHEGCGVDLVEAVKRSANPIIIHQARLLRIAETEVLWDVPADPVGDAI